MAKRKRNIPQRNTLLLVAEGDTEVAFLKYLKGVFRRDPKSPKVKVQNAHGKGPDNVLRTAMGAQRGASFDQVAVVLDTDIPWSKAFKEKARKAGIELIGNSPCIEGTFLAMLGCQVPKQSALCKKLLAERVPYSLLNKSSYGRWCDQTMLQDAANHMTDLRRILELYQGK